MNVDLTALAAPFAPNQIEWRVGSTTGDKKKGMALAYLTARDVMDRLDEVCGAANWQDRYEFHGARTICYLSIRLGDEWVTKADGAGDSDVEAEKGAISDALKRCAVKWGIGRYLYDVKSPWVEIEPMGRSFKIKDSEMSKLERVLPRAGTAPAPQREEAPKPKPAANDALTDDRQKTIADSLIGAMSFCRSVASIREWKQDEKHNILLLTGKHMERVGNAFKAREAELMDDEPVSFLEAGE